MITKGNKIKLVKPMGLFTNVGEICEVTDVTEGGIITFRFGMGGRHLGCMSYDEYQKYFEPVEEKKPRAWTEWKTTVARYFNIKGESVHLEICYRHNGKKVQVKNIGWGVKAEATCHRIDKFNFVKGIDLAEKRLVVKILDKQVKEIAKEM